MTMTIDPNQQRFTALSFNHLSSYNHAPHFSNPWAASSSAAPSQAVYSHASQQAQQVQASSPRSAAAPGGVSMASFASLPVTTASSSTGPLGTADPVFVGQSRRDLLSMPQDMLALGRMQPPTSAAAYGDSAYAAAASPVHATYATASSNPYEGLGYATAHMRQTFALAPETDQASRRYSHSSVPSTNGGSVADTMPRQSVDVSAVPGSRGSFVDFPDISGAAALTAEDRRAFADRLEASQGMLSMSQETPRANVYNARARHGSDDSYGFPGHHSNSSSVSSGGGFSAYPGSLSDYGSVSDYSAAGSDIESVAGSIRGRTDLARSHGVLASGQQPPAPQSMMGQFSSKVSSSPQKKHKCKVCDKRFTRPSSLQTHMYSHTGEKPFACEVEGCGRNFSVVSNLRRHRKVHRHGGQVDGVDGHQSD